MLATISISTTVLGFFMAMPLFLLAGRRRANFWLGCFVLAVALISLADYCNMVGVYKNYPQLFGVFDWPVACVGAFYYCYVRSVLGLGNARRQLLHLIFPLVAIGMLVYLRVAPKGEAKLIVFFAFVVSSQVFAIGYSIAVLVRLRQYRRVLRENYSSTKGRDLLWLNWLSAVLWLVLFAWLAGFFLHAGWSWVLALGRMLMLYFLGWYGMRQMMVIVPTHEPSKELGNAPNNEHKNEHKNEAHIELAVQMSLPQASASLNQAPSAMAENVEQSTEQTIEADKYARSGMNLGVQELIGARLTKRMQQEHDFLDNDIKLSDLAQSIGTSPQLLSQYLNTVLGLNFFDYINSLRVAEVQRMMLDPAYADTTLLDLALRAGFNSKSTFNSSFKKITGMAPSNWRKQGIGESCEV